MFGTARDLGDRLQQLVDDLDPDCYDGPGAVRMLDAFTRLENLAAYGKAAMARRVEYTRAWKREGDATAARFLARRTGTTVGQAAATLKTARQLEDLGAVAEAAKAGELSGAQTNEIAEACAADPGAEKGLVAKATTGSFEELREDCQRVKAAAREDEVAHHDAMRRQRYLRTWTDRDGAGRGEWKVPPDAQAKLLARLAVETDAVAADAKTADAPIESCEAYAADALVRLADSDRGGGASSSKAVIHLRVDHAAYGRGHTEPGEICEIEGVGPVPVATARSLSSDAVIYALVTTGQDITRVANLGRTIPAALRVALEHRDPVCVELGCSVRDHLEIHHKKPLAEGGPTTLDNLERRCPWHHYLATHHPDRSPPDRSPPDELPLAV
jgi:hypothetical protein